MERLCFSAIGNLKGYEHQPRTARARGLVVTPDLVLKLYSMARDSHPTNRTIRYTRRLLEREIADRRIEPLTGLGFAILSENMLNVARWDTEYPTLLKNRLYVFGASVKPPQPLDINEAGTFCIWELGIVGHEKEAWKRFLNSHRGEAEKDRYLRDIIEGNL